VFTSQYNLSPVMGIELLSRITKIFKDYCGVLSEESIRSNFVLCYELLEEIIDFGYIQSTSTEQLKAFVFNAPVEVKGAVQVRNVVSLSIYILDNDKILPDFINQPINLCFSCVGRWCGGCCGIGP
jgi:hypothetical protein